MANSERERKWKEEIKEVLAGADEVHSDLLLWLAKGPDRLTSKVYSLKSRVKDEKSLFRKIRHKIKEEGKEYSAKNATDIIGLRLLCLNNDKLPALVEGFVRFIEACQRGDVLFERGSLADAIVEIKIYQSQDNLLVYEDIHARLLLRRIQNAQERPKIELEKSTDEDPYSSVHFVCRLRGEKGKRFFLEVQIRTIFEDAWAEIEHPLRYKGTAYFGGEQSLDQQNLKRIASTFLKGLKKNLDYCLTITDNINDLYSGIDSALGGRGGGVPSRLTSVGNHVGSSSFLDNEMPEEIKLEINSQIDARVNVLSASSPETKTADAQVDETIQILEKINEKYRDGYPDRHAQDAKFSFFFQMEKAYLFMLKNKFFYANNVGVADPQEYAKKALDQYRELDRDSKYADQATLKFRYATAALITKNDGLAQSLLSEAVDLLKNDKTIPSNHLLRVTIPRQHAFVMWRSKQEIWYDGAREKDFRYKTKEQESILQKCRRQTKQCLADLRRVEESPDRYLEAMRAWNNYISYMWELGDIGVDSEKLSSQEIKEIKELLPKMDDERERFTRKLSGLDTALKASKLINDAGSQAKYWALMAEHLKLEMEDPTSNEGYSSDELDFFLYSLRRNAPVDVIQKMQS